MRLLVCHECKTMEELPDYDGPLETAEVPLPDGTMGTAEVPPVGADHLLDHLAEPHRRQEHLGQLLHIEDDDWHDNQRREEILKHLKEKIQHTGLDPEAYAMRNTFQEDALKCFNRHNRPQNGCIDWHDRSKRLGNSLFSEEERKAIRKHGLGRGAQRFLCDFCPVASQVQQKVFDKAGLYDK